MGLTFFQNAQFNVVFKMVMKIPKKSVVSEIWSVEMGTANDPYLQENFVFRRQCVKAYSVLPFSKNSFHIETS